MSIGRLLAVILLLGAQPALAQVLAEWVENDPANDPNKLALGYPVPTPVDTPLPFDGFRTYAGLHARHQDLAATTPWVHPENIGLTRLGRTIWAYRLGDADLVNRYGFPEPATLTNGGIHAREWQTPEIVTGILELFATRPLDRHYYDYLRDNLNMVVIPSLNIDGFLQTQRYPAHNYLGSDPDFPATSPRDGRMRRKNLRNADENLNSVADHLEGVDLNRNNPAFWNNGGSTSDSRGLTYHGPAPQSEPETQALDVAAALGPAEQLRLYTDVHSFSQVHFWNQGSNQRLAGVMNQVLGLFSNHHFAFPAAKNYLSVPSFGGGIGTTADHFNFNYQVPSWTLEVEPSSPIYHPQNPGTGADYGGTNENGHDGFILPESQIRRVREELAETFAALYYRQLGAPSVQAVRVLERDTRAVVFEAEWDRVDDFNRQLMSRQLQPLKLGREYDLWLAFSKPMRWLEDDQVALFQGMLPGFNTQFTEFELNDALLNVNLGEVQWGISGFDAPGGYQLYKTDALTLPFDVPSDGINDLVIQGPTEVKLRNLTWDMVGNVTDANPATALYWSDGHWENLEATNGSPGDFGGRDATITMQITDGAVPSPFLVEPGVAAAWGDPDRVGEGFILEMLPGDIAVMFWFTNDEEGGQDWYISVGEVRGNRILFAEVLRVSGGVFGEDFDPALVTETPVGQAKFTWTDCGNAYMDWHLDNRRGRQNLRRLTTVMGLDCGPPKGAPVSEHAVYSGAWGDPTHDGEGITLEILEDGSALAFWFSFGPDGKRRWYFGIGQFSGDGKLVFDNLLTTIGGVFGSDFDPDDVSEVHWGTMELDLSCDGGTLTYQSVEDGFGSGMQNLEKLTDFPGLDCDA